MDACTTYSQTALNGRSRWAFRSSLAVFWSSVFLSCPSPFVGLPRTARLSNVARPSLDFVMSLKTIHLLPKKWKKLNVLLNSNVKANLEKSLKSSKVVTFDVSSLDACFNSSSNGPVPTLL